MQYFEKMIRKNGENLQLLSGDISLPFKASLVESTKATYSVNNRANFFQGQSLKKTSDDTKYIDVGDYFIRSNDNNCIYFVMSTIPEPSCPNLIYLYAVRCNAKVSITRYMDDVDINDETQINKWEKPIATDIWVNKDTVTRSMKGTNDGLLDQAIYVLSLPKTHGVELLDKVYIGNEIYRVDSINDTLINIDMSGGIDMLQLSYLSTKDGGGI